MKIHDQIADVIRAANAVVEAQRDPDAFKPSMAKLEAGLEALSEWIDARKKNAPKLEGDRIEQFERAFSTHTSSCRVECDCGTVFWNESDRGCFDPGEIDELKANPRARCVDYSIGILSFEGRQFADGCDCWHARAAQIAKFIDAHRFKIAEWLTLEKARLQAEADAAPTVDLHTRAFK